jgi:RNA polymerase sigma factor (sigma-70 family)
VADCDQLAFLKQLDHPRTARDGWSFFVHQYSGLLLHTIREFESDYDEVLDRYLYICQKLTERNFQRFTRFTHGGQKEFAAWLRAVARNLCIDHAREQKGRRRLPRGIARLPELDQEVFQAVYWQGHSATDAFEVLRSVRPELEFPRVLDSLKRIEGSVRPWKLAQLAHSSRQQLSGAGHGISEEVVARVPDGRPNPEADALTHEKFRALEEAVSELPPSDRLLLRLRFEMGLNLEQTATASGMADHRQAHDRLAQILEKLRERLSAKGWQ